MNDTDVQVGTEGDGTLDTSFNQTGKRTTDFFGAVDTGAALVIQPDGKMLVAGTTGSDVALTRYNTDGTTDFLFGNLGDGRLRLDFSGGTDSGLAIGLQTAGDQTHIVVAGYTYSGTTSRRFAVARFNGFGLPDGSFGDGGKLTTGIGVNAEAHGIVILPDGRIVVAGYSNGNFAVADYDFAAVAYLADNTVKTVPKAPSALTAAALSANQVRLEWTDNSAVESGFRIERSTDAGGIFTELGVSAANSTSYVAAVPAGDSDYVFRIRAYNAGGNSAYGNSAGATTPIVSQPSSLAAAVVSATQINLSWTDNSSDEVAFDVQVSTAGGAFSRVTALNANSTSYSVTGLNPSTAYAFRVRAYNNLGQSPFSDVVSATTSLLSIPAAPGSLSATANSSGQVTLAWVDNSSNDDGVLIEQSSAGNGFLEIGRKSAGTTDFTAGDLAPGTAYTFRVRTFNAAGISAGSNMATAVPVAASAVPASPASLAATAVSGGRINLSWSHNSSDEDGFVIEESTDGTNFSDAYVAAAASASFTVDQLQHSTQYSYRVRAYNNAGESSRSNVASATTLAGPSAPTNLTASATAAGQVVLNWTDNSTNEKAFVLSYSVNGTDFLFLDSVDQGITTYTAANLTVGTQYTFRAYAQAEFASSDYSNLATATPVAAASPPAALTHLTAAAATATQVDLMWSDKSSTEDGFAIEQSTDGGTTFSQIAVTAPNTATYAVTGLSPNTAYLFRIRSFNAAGNSAYTSSVGATTANQAAPAAPGNLVATSVTGTQIDLAWTDNSDNEAGFSVEQSQDGGATWLTPVTMSGSSYSVADLTPETTYTFRVRAANSGGYSAYSDNTSTTTLAVAAPSVPTALTATATSTEAVDLSWTDAASNEGGFKIEAAAAGGAYAEIAVVDANTTSFRASALTAGTTYSFRVRAYNAGSDGSISNTATATTFPPAPADPDTLAAVAVQGARINLSWLDHSTDEQGFLIERSDDGANFSELQTVAPNTTSFSDDSVTGGTRYYYQVLAFNGPSFSGETAEVGATALGVVPDAPTGLTATVASSSQINLSWTDASTNEEGFIVEQSNDGVDFSSVATLPADTVSYAAGSLTSGANYSFRVRAFNKGSSSTYSNAATATIALPAPSGLTATSETYGVINLHWVRNASGHEQGFRVERSTSAGGTFTEVATIDANGTDYADLTLGGTFFYRVRSFNAAGDSAYSNTASASVTMPLSAPITPSAVTAAGASTSSINVAWSDNSDNESGFEVWMSKDGGTWTKKATVAGNTTSYQVTGLTSSWAAAPVTDYAFRIRAINGTLASRYSEAVHATTTPGASTNPAAPTDLQAFTLGHNEFAALIWTDQADAEVRYVVERSEAGSGVWQLAASLTGSANHPNFMTTAVRVVKPSTLYTFRVTAFGPGGLGDSASASLDYTSSDTIIEVPKPSIVDAQVTSSTSINVTFAGDSSPDYSYGLQVTALGPVTNLNQTSIGVSPTDSTHFVATGLDPGTRYQLRVMASYEDPTPMFHQYEPAVSDPVERTTPAAAPTVSIEAIDSMASESGSRGVFVIRQTGGALAPLTIHYSTDGTLDDSASSTDYQALSGVVTIPLGADAVILPVDAVDDALPEWTEGVTVSIVPTTDYGVSANAGRAVVEVVDNDLNVAIADPTILANTDDDNGNGVADSLDTSAAEGEDDLVPLSLGTPSGVRPGAHVSLRVNNPSINVWTTQHKDGLLIGGDNRTRTWTIGAEVVPTTVWVEALAAHDTDGVTEFLLTADDSTATPPRRPTHPSTTQASVDATANSVELVWRDPTTGTEANAGATVPDVLIGQKLSPRIEVHGKVWNRSQYNWFIGGRTFKDWYPTTFSATATHLDAFDLRQSSLDHFQWAVPGEGLRVVCSGLVNGKAFHRETAINVLAPDVVGSSAVEQPTDLDTTQGGNGLLELKLGKVDVNLTTPPALINGMVYKAQVKLPAAFAGGQPGNWTFLQTMDPNRSWDDVNGKVWRLAPNGGAPGIKFVLDRVWPYQEPVNTNAIRSTFLDSPAMFPDWYRGPLNKDAAGNARPPAVKVTLEDKMHTYIMFQPPGEGSQWVSVELLEWTYKGIATWSTNHWTFAFGEESPSKGTIDEPKGARVYTNPGWQNNFSLMGWV